STAHLGDILQVDRMSIVHSDDEIGDLFPIGEEFARLYGNGGIVADELAGVRDDVRRRERLHELRYAQTMSGKAQRIEAHTYDIVGTADRVYVARAGHSLELRLDRVRD